MEVPSRRNRRNRSRNRRKQGRRRQQFLLRPLRLGKTLGTTSRQREQYVCEGRPPHAALGYSKRPHDCVHCVLRLARLGRLFPHVLHVHMSVTLPLYLPSLLR